MADSHQRLGGTVWETARERRNRGKAIVTRAIVASNLIFPKSVSVSSIKPAFYYLDRLPANRLRPPTQEISSTGGRTLIQAP